MRKISFLLVAMICWAVSAMASEPNVLNLHQTDGEVESIILVDIEHISFEDDAIVITTTDGVFQLPLDEVSRIVFGKQSTTTDTESLPAADLQLTLVDNQLSIAGGYAINTLYLVDIAGKILLTQKCNGVSETSVSLPQSGVFVLFLDTNKGYVARKLIVN